jgi:hypothetical protein
VIRAKSGRIIRPSLAEINPWAKDGLGLDDFALLAPAIAVALAVAVPVEQIPGKTKCIGMMVVSVLSLGLGVLALASAIRSSYTAGVVTAILAVVESLATGLLGFVGFAWLWIDLKD